MMVKVCGMRDADNIRAAEQLGVDMMGFIFWPRSSRHVSRQPEYLPSHCKRVGVFVNEDIDTVRQTARDYALDYIQLHGQESPEYVCQLLNSQLSGCKVIKAFNVSHACDFIQTEAYAALADLFLFDTKGKSAGGNGEKFDWRILADYNGDTPFLLSGGIGPDDASLVKEISHPKCLGVDLNSRFEVAAGIKDINKLQSFIKRLRQ